MTKATPVAVLIVHLLFAAPGRGDDLIATTIKDVRQRQLAGEFDQGIATLTKLIADAEAKPTKRILLDDERAILYFLRGDCHRWKNDWAATLADFKTAARLAPEQITFLAHAARTAATAPDDRVRDAKYAVATAEKAMKLLDAMSKDGSLTLFQLFDQTWDVTDVLAAAYAEDGRFVEAVKTLKVVTERIEQELDNPLNALGVMIFFRGKVDRKLAVAKHRLEAYRKQVPLRAPDYRVKFRAMQAAWAFLDATVDGKRTDPAKRVDALHPAYVQELGGRDKAIEGYERVVKTRRAEGSRLAIRLDDVGDFVTDGRTTSVAMATEITVTENQTAHHGTSYLLGVSDDGGKTWTFLEGGALEAKGRKEKLLPALPKGLLLPEVNLPVVSRVNR